jgi:hypothetical protein
MELLVNRWIQGQIREDLPARPPGGSELGWDFLLLPVNSSLYSQLNRLNPNKLLLFSRALDKPRQASRGCLAPGHTPPRHACSLHGTVFCVVGEVSAAGLWRGAQCCGRLWQGAKQASNLLWTPWPWFCAHTSEDGVHNIRSVMAII